MRRIGLKLAGVVAILSAVTTIPANLLVFNLQKEHSMPARIQIVLLIVITTLVAIFLLWSFRKYLRGAFRFDGIDSAVNCIIYGSLLYAGYSGYVTIHPLPSDLEALNVLPLVPLGFFQFLLGFRLLRLENDLNRLQRPYSYLNMILGIATASVYLSPLAVFVSPIADVMLATIFLEAAKNIEKPPQRQ